jgi:hypothetical protein
MDVMKGSKPLQVVIDGLRIEDLIKEDFKESLKRAFPEFEINIIRMDIALPHKPMETPPPTPTGVRRAILTIETGRLDTLAVFHRSSEDYRTKKVVLSSTNEDLTERFLKALMEVIKK